MRTVQRWWQSYREGGLAGLLAPAQRRGLAERITPEAWEGLQAEMRAGHIGGLHEAQVYLRDTWHIAYPGLFTSEAAYVIFPRPFNFELFGSTSGPVSVARGPVGLGLRGRVAECGHTARHIR